MFKKYEDKKAMEDAFIEPEAKEFILITDLKNHYTLWVSEDTAALMRKEQGAHLVPKHAYKMPRRFAD